MVRRSSFSLALTSLVCLLTVGAAVPALADPNDPLLEGVSVALPLESQVKVRWVCPPGDANDAEKARWYGNHCFAVDASGQPWLALPNAGLILRPTQQLHFRLSHPFTGMACLPNGALLFVTDHDLGMIGATDRPAVKKGVPVLPLQPVLSLPAPGRSVGRGLDRPAAWRAYPGSGNCLYVVGTDGDNGQEILLLQPQAGKDDPRQVLRSFRQIFASARPVLAVAGDGQTTYAALGRTVVRIGAGRTDTQWWVHPTDEVKELAYSPDVGLFYATERAVGVLTSTGAWEFLRGYRADLALQGGSLYIFLPETLAVLALDHVADLAQVRPVTVAPATPSAQVSDIKFRAHLKSSDPNNDRTVPGAVFEGRDTFYVTGDVHLHPLGKQDHPTLLTVQWQNVRTGETQSDGVAVDLSDGNDLSWSFNCKVGLGKCGYFYPGRYTMTVLIDGVKARTDSFQVRGSPTLIEAVADDDPATVQALLEKGASPDERDTHALHETALHTAAMTDVRLVQLLLEHGAHVNARNDAGETPLFCVQYCDAARVRQITATLVQYGADVNAVDNIGMPVLLTLAREGSYDLVDLLLQHGANPNQMVTHGSNQIPLLVELLYADFRMPQTASILELLLDHGANPNIREVPPVGQCAMDLAVANPEPQYVQILLRHGALLDPPPSGRTESQLHQVLQSYLDGAARDRVLAQKAKDVFFILRAYGARLRPQEEPIVADKRLHGWLPQDFVLDVLQRNDQAVLDARDLTDPLLQQVVISRLLDLARAKTAAATSKEGYQAALALCDQAKTRAQIWKIETQCPLVYYNTGLLYGQLGEIEAAKDNFRRYLALAPNAQDADAIRQSVGL